MTATATATEYVFRLPDLGEGLTEAEILQWRVDVGDVVTVDQIVVEVETAKAAVDVPVPVAGTVVRLHGRPGTVVDVGAPLVTVAVAGDRGPLPQAPGDRDRTRDDEARRRAREAMERHREEERAGSGNVLVGYGTSETRRSRRRAARSAARAAALLRDTAGTDAPARLETKYVTTGPALAEEAKDEAAGGRRTEAPRVISPVVRRLAREHSLDLAAVQPSGPGGVILRRDIDAAIAAAGRNGGSAGTAMTRDADQNGTAPGAKTVPSTDAVLGTEPAEEPVRVPLRGLRRAVADKLARSRREIPDATTWVDVDATPLVELKEEIGRACPDAGVGILALLARICVAGLRRYPELNAYVDAERAEIVRLPRINLGFAAQTDRGLVVPVVHDAHRLTLAELAGRLRELTRRAREGTLTPHDLTGGTFTLNNYGVFGVDGSTPIINHPEAALLGVGRITDRPWGVDGELRLRKVAQLSFTFDHRVCDGGVAGGFLRFVADCVERPQVLITNL